MKFKHLAMLFATLFLPACSNNTPNNNDAERLQSQTIDDSIVTEEQIQPPIDNGSVHYGVDVIDNKNEIKEETLPNQEETALPDSPIVPEEKAKKVENDTSSSSLLASYSTKVYTKTKARMNNLNIVCKKISGVVVNPGEEFSYNNVAGPYDKAHGFGKATILLGNGKEVQGYGGGVCQVSSTLYNAVKDCNVEITERHNHSKDIHYVPRNQDATVSYGNLDFKFKNNNDYPIKIEASANKQKVTVEIYKA